MANKKDRDIEKGCSVKQRGNKLGEKDELLGSLRDALEAVIPYCQTKV